MINIRNIRISDLLVILNGLKDKGISVVDMEADEEKQNIIFSPVKLKLPPSTTNQFPNLEDFSL